ncbi:Innexin, partial [Trinorchestia longiramus]
FRSFNVVQQFSQLVSTGFPGIKVTHSSPSDGRILRMHYQWTLWLLLTGFVCVYYNWFTRDIIVCVSHFNADVQVRLDYLSICLSYLFVRVDGEKNNLLFYRWVHWALLILTIVYFIPRWLSKTHENPKLKHLFVYLNANGHHYDGTEKQLVDSAAKYMVKEMRTHKSLFLKYWSWNVVALATDVFAFYFVDWLLLGRFKTLGFAAYPYYRDGRNQTDYISKTFPPFAECTIGMAQELTNRRIERFGCHLTAMEIYEKLFFVVWFWLIFLSIITAGYIIFLALFFHPKGRDLILRFSKPMLAPETSRKTMENLAKFYEAGDYFVLYKMRQHFAHRDFYELLRKISDQEYCDLVMKSLKNEHPLY